MISFPKKSQTKLGFLVKVLDYNFYQYNLIKVLKNYLKLLTQVVKLSLTDYQRIVNLY